MLVDGKAVALRIREDLHAVLADSGVKARVDIITVGSDATMEAFVRAKRNFAERIGIAFHEHNVPADSTETALLELIQKVQQHTRAIVVQLPLPSHINQKTILDAIDADKDVDVLGSTAYSEFEAGTSRFIPPVAGAVLSILNYYNIPLRDVYATVVGDGALVGRPVAHVLQREGANVTSVNKETSEHEKAKVIAAAEIIVTGVGIPGLLQPSMVAENAVIIDAGTSTQNGVTRGDAAPECAIKARLFSPTPGGVGPVTVAMLFKNIVRAWV